MIFHPAGNENPISVSTSAQTVSFPLRNRQRDIDMNEYEKEMLRAQFAASYFRNVKGNPGAFVCLYCGGLSHQDPPKEGVPPSVVDLIPRNHQDDCPVADKTKALDL